METNENLASDLIRTFIKRMNKWEIMCNEIASDNTLSFEEQFQKQKVLLLDIFNACCTNRERKNGKPNTISYGEEGSFEYDPKEEIVIKVMRDKNTHKKMHVFTFREDPLDEKFEYTLIEDNGRFLIDSKKLYDEHNDRWKSISL